MDFHGAFFILTIKTTIMKNFEDHIFFDETTTTTTTKKKIKMDYGRPPGWNKKPKKKNEIFEFFRIMRDNFVGRELEPSELRRYDIWMLDIKATIFSGIFTFCLFYVLFTSGLSSEKYSEHRDDPSLLDMVINYFTKENDENAELIPAAPKSVVIVKDSLVNIDSIAYIIQQSDSILKAVRAADTNHLN